MLQEIFPQAQFQAQYASSFNSFGVKTASRKVVVNSYNLSDKARNNH